MKEMLSDRIVVSALDNNAYSGKQWQMLHNIRVSFGKDQEKLKIWFLPIKVVYIYCVKFRSVVLNMGHMPHRGVIQE